MSKALSSPILFRGERDGVLRANGSWMQPYFFAEKIAHAKRYAGHNTEPIACRLQCERILDLTEPDRRNPDHSRIIGAFAAEYDDWTCRYSGEPREAWNFIETGDLYDYEGTGSGERWNKLFRWALDEFDAVRILDRTDGNDGEAVPVWVTIHRAHIRQASTGEELWARLQQSPIAETSRWLEREHPDLLTRVKRLTVIDEEYRLDNLQAIVPREEFQKLPDTSRGLTIWRGLPAGARIRPGDWVALSRDYAEAHGHRENDRPAVDSLTQVLASDIYWAGTDMREHFYLPQAWRRDGMDLDEYLGSLTRDMAMALADGELHSLTRHKDALAAINTHVVDNFDAEACGQYHGPDHWARVSNHGIAVARSLALDPLVPYVFGMVHDSQRWHDGYDPKHGPRAAAFAHTEREGLFAFLTEDDFRLLCHACEDHSEGYIEAPAIVQASFDSDRLDLGRIDVCPDPDLLCTEYARNPGVIHRALELSGAHDLAARYVREIEAEMNDSEAYPMDR